MGVQLTLLQPGGADYAHHITASPPGFENPAASLLCICIWNLGFYLFFKFSYLVGYKAKKEFWLEADKAWTRKKASAGSDFEVKVECLVGKIFGLFPINHLVLSSSNAMYRV